MPLTGWSHRTVVTVAAFVGAVLTVAACGSSSSTTSSTTLSKAAATTNSGTPTSGKVSSIAALVPAEIRDRGVINVATEDFPPATYQTAGGQLTGWEVALGHEIGTVLGVPFVFHLIDFSAIIPGLQGGKYDLGMGDIAITPARERVVNFVSTHEANESFAAPTSSSLHLTGMTDACGLNLALLLGGVEVEDAKNAEPLCAKAGKKSIDIQQYPSQPQANLALQSGRAQLEATDSDSIAYVLSQTHGEFKVVGRYGPDELTGIAIAKTPYAKQFALALQKAVQYLVGTGAYAKIFRQFNQGLGGIPANMVQVNPTKTAYTP